MVCDGVLRIWVVCWMAVWLNWFWRGVSAGAVFVMLGTMLQLPLHRLSYMVHGIPAA